MAGAAIFWSLEQPNEISVREENLETISTQRREFLRKLWLMNADMDLSEPEWREKAKTDIDNITRLLFNAFDTHYITAHHLNYNDTLENTWTFQAAIFFTATLLTTIGRSSDVK